MKTINLNNKKLNVSVSCERVLQHLSDNGFVSGVPEFDRGHGRFGRNEVMSNLTKGEECGFKIVYRWHDGLSKKVVKWFEDHKRNSSCVVGDKRRINTILKKLGEV